MGTVAYSCPYVPAEWIAAHGLSPRRLLPGTSAPTGIPAGEGRCSFMMAFLREAAGAGAAGIVATTVCDQIRRGAEQLTRESPCPVFLLNVPATWQTHTAQKLYLSELQRLGRFLVELGGVAPSAEVLAETMLDYDAKRAALRGLQPRLSAREHAETVARFHETGLVSPPETPGGPRVGGIRVGIVGGPLLREQLGLLDYVEDNGGRIVLDGTETGERTFPAPFDRRECGRDLLAELTRAYFESIPDAFKRPNSRLYEWLKTEIAAREIQGLVAVRQVWCDLWHAETGRLREWLEIPLLDLDLEETGITSRAASRIEAFLETLA